MKTMIFAAFILVAVSSFTNANMVSRVVAPTDVRHISESKVPAPVLDNFKSMYPDATSVKWDILTGAYQQNTQYMAEFRLNGAKRTARYSPDGTYLGGS